MKLMNLLNLTTDFFAHKRIDNPRLNAELLLCHLLGVRRLDLYLAHDRPMTPGEVMTFREMVRRRGGRYPLQYITGRVEFMSLTFQVGPGVFIPRPETEALVEAVMERLSMDHDLQLADVGTGAGAVAVSVAAHFPRATLWATDISPKALRMAQINAERNGVENRILFLKGDLFGPLRGAKLQGRLDAIISNPPYIPRDDLELLPEEVRFHEPRAALDGGQDGLYYHRRLVEEAPTFLKEGGVLAIEMGAGQAEQVAALIVGIPSLDRIKIIKDLSHIDRVLLSQKKGGER